jgi:hypothetical protein
MHIHRRRQAGTHGTSSATSDLYHLVTVSVSSPHPPINTRLSPPISMGVALCGMMHPSKPDPFMPPQGSRLLKLPDELLLSIARKLPRNVHLCRLSLVCRRWKVVAQEALVKEVSLPPCGMRELIRTLCDRPDLCEKIVSVDLDDYTITGRSSDSWEVAEWCHFHRCRDIVGSQVFDDLVETKHGDAVHPLWSTNHRFFLDVLIASCPNIKKLSLRLPGSEQDPLPVLVGECSHRSRLGSLQASTPVQEFPL